VTTAFVFPGQGAQQPGMLTALPESATTRAVLDQAATELGDLARFDSPVGSTTDIQLALLICGVAAARHLTDDRGTHVDVVAGHSVGAYAAAVTAGVLTFAEALDVVRIRGDEMTLACPPGEWGMAAVTGLSRRQVEKAVDALGDRLWIANINAADQLVLGGTRAALDGARDAVERAGARRFEPLDVPVASHGPVQRGTETALRERLSRIPRREQRVDYLADSTARRIRKNSGAVLEDLARSVSCAVRWYDIARLMPELGVDRVIEIPPGNVLSRLIESATSGVRVETGFPR
jgi:malonate decarboxylase epsilon subunit